MNTIAGGNGRLWLLVSLGAIGFRMSAGEPAPPFRAAVEVEEELYSYVSADNGAGPMWCGGSTCLVRWGDRVYASGLETLTDAKPLNNCRWVLYGREAGGWVRQRSDTEGRTREPCPLVVFGDGRVFLSANPTLVEDRNAYGGPARPEIFEFGPGAIETQPRRLLPQWQGQPDFTEHSYRSFAADGQRRELILFQNVGYTHAEWTFLDRDGRWSAQGRLEWPWGAEYAKPQPIRVCYPNVALAGRAVHFCGVSDIIEPNPAWREYKKALTGREWDYDFRRLFYTWTPDIGTAPFQGWTEIASRESTCGWISPADLWVDPEGAAHVLWTERAIDERLRDRFFPEAKQSHELNYAVVREGKVVRRRNLLRSTEEAPGEVASAARFHATPGHRLWVLLYVQGRDSAGRGLSENRLLELGADGQPGRSLRLDLDPPFTGFFTATVRAGSAPAGVIDILGPRAGRPLAMAYARIRLVDQ